MKCPTPECTREARTYSPDGQAVLVALCEECAEREIALEVAAEEKQTRKRLLERLQAGNQRLRDWSLGTYPRDEFGKAALRAGLGWLAGYEAGERRNLVMFGTVGTGKTGLAWSLARALVEQQRVEARLVNFRDALREIRESFNDNRDRPDISWRRSRVLFLDDLGAERSTAWALEELATLIEYRYERVLPTVVTSNYEPEELARRLSPEGDMVVGQRIVSRLMEGAFQFRFTGTDRRV